MRVSSSCSVGARGRWSGPGAKHLNTLIRSGARGDSSAAAPTPCALRDEALLQLAALVRARTLTLTDRT